MRGERGREGSERKVPTVPCSERRPLQWTWATAGLRALGAVRGAATAATADTADGEPWVTERHRRGKGTQPALQYPRPWPACHHGDTNPRHQGSGLCRRVPKTGAVRVFQRPATSLRHDRHGESSVGFDLTDLNSDVRIVYEAIWGFPLYRGQPVLSGCLLAAI